VLCGQHAGVSLCVCACAGEPERAREWGNSGSSGRSGCLATSSDSSSTGPHDSCAGGVLISSERMPSVAGPVKATMTVLLPIPRFSRDNPPPDGDTC
jgi:hypothetical protein